MTTRVDVKSLPHFFELVEKYRMRDRFNRPRHAFRGAGTAPSELIPGIGRDLWRGNQSYTLNNKEWCEKLALDLFSQRCVAYLDPRPANPLQVMVHAQHHGLPTRLLDWTFSALVALHFALDRREKLGELCDVIVYVTRLPDDLIHAPKRKEIEEDPLSADRDYLVVPSWINRRIAAQQSCFILHADFRKHAMPEAALVIGASQVELMQRQLHEIGFALEALFPDPDGLARSITYDVFGSRKPFTEDKTEAEKGNGPGD